MEPNLFVESVKWKVLSTYTFQKKASKEWSLMLSFGSVILT